MNPGVLRLPPATRANRNRAQGGRVRGAGGNNGRFHPKTLRSGGEGQGRAFPRLPGHRLTSSCGASAPHPHPHPTLTPPHSGPSEQDSEVLTFFIERHNPSPSERVAGARCMRPNAPWPQPGVQAGVGGGRGIEVLPKRGREARRARASLSGRDTGFGSSDRNPSYGTNSGRVSISWFHLFCLVHISLWFESMLENQGMEPPKSKIPGI